MDIWGGENFGELLLCMRAPVWWHINLNHFSSLIERWQRKLTVVFSSQRGNGTQWHLNSEIAYLDLWNQFSQTVSTVFWCFYWTPNGFVKALRAMQWGKLDGSLFFFLTQVCYCAYNCKWVLDTAIFRQEIPAVWSNSCHESDALYWRATVNHTNTSLSYFSLPDIICICIILFIFAGEPSINVHYSF